MTSTTDQLAALSASDYQAQIRSLENECRDLRETLRDKFAMAAIQGTFYHAQAKGIDCRLCQFVASIFGGAGFLTPSTHP